MNKHTNRIKYIVWVGTMVPIILVTLLGFTILNQFNLSEENNKWVEHTHEVLIAAHDIEKLKVDMETGQRGFIITGKEHFLEPFNVASNAIFKEIEDLKKKVSDNPPQVVRLSNIEQQMNDWLETAGNPEIEARRKYDRGEIQFQNVADLLIVETGKQQIDALRKLLAEFIAIEEGLTLSRQETAASGIMMTKLILSVGVIAIVLTGLLTGFFSSQMLQKQQAKLEVAYIEAKVAKEKAETANKAKSEFLANMSHELRTPLNSLLILADELRENDEENLTSAQLEDITIIYQSGKDLLGLINDILDLSKIEAGEIDVYIEDTLIKDIADNITLRFSHVAKKRNLSLRVNIEENIPKLIYSDKTRLEQILSNFLSNALKFTHEGGITVNIFKEDEHIIFSVSDTGIGIPAEKLDDVFEEFRQADGSISREYGGTGLGLSISRKLSGLLGGEVRLESREGEGSTFFLHLPEKFSEET